MEMGPEVRLYPTGAMFTISPQPLFRFLWIVYDLKGTASDHHPPTPTPTPMVYNMFIADEGIFNFKNLTKLFQYRGHVLSTCEYTIG